VVATLRSERLRSPGLRSAWAVINDPTLFEQISLPDEFSQLDQELSANVEPVIRAKVAEGYSLGEVHSGGMSESTRLFLSWAHADLRLKTKLVALLSEQLRIMRGVRFEWWEDSHINSGEQWRREIMTRLDESDYTVQLTSPSFFASRFIVEHELPPFVGERSVKAALPVGLRPVSLAGDADLHGLDGLQIFKLDGKCFSELSTAAQRDRFVRELASEIRRRILGTDPWRTV
jgi:hypothetical protein